MQWDGKVSISGTLGIRTGGSRIKSCGRAVSGRVSPSRNSAEKWDSNEFATTVSRSLSRTEYAVRMSLHEHAI
jgi:hypothetical protein